MLHARTNVLGACAAAVALLIVTASGASAQAEKRLGLMMGFPTAAGVQWKVNDRFTLRGDAGFDWGVVDQVTVSSSVSINGVPVSASSRTTSFQHSTVSLGVSGLVTVARYDQLRLYVAPRAGWRRLHSAFSSETSGASFPGIDTSNDTVTNGLLLEGMFGANYRLAERFSIYGETGIGFTSPTSTSSSELDEMTSYTIGSRVNIGVVIHF